MWLNTLRVFSAWHWLYSEWSGEQQKKKTSSEQQLCEWNCSWAGWTGWLEQRRCANSDNDSLKQHVQPKAGWAPTAQDHVSLSPPTETWHCSRHTLIKTGQLKTRKHRQIRWIWISVDAADVRLWHQEHECMGSTCPVSSIQAGVGMIPWLAPGS